MKVPVYLHTHASYYLGDVEIEKPGDYEVAADALWESKDYEFPTLCHQCAKVDLSDWFIDDVEVDFYFKGQNPASSPGVI